MSRQFEAFYKDWCSFEVCDRSVAPYDPILRFNLEINSRFFNQLKFDADSLRLYRIQAAARCKEMLGARPVLCLSGGVDSQAMIQCWTEAGIEFDVAVLVFDKELNKQDVDHARLYCSQRNITPVEIPLSITRFLATESYDLAVKYKCNSPQFATHYKLFDILRDRGYTGICAGGVYPYYSQREGWKMPHTSATINFVEYSQKNNFPAMGSFLSYSPELAWTLGILSIPFIDTFENSRSQEWLNIMNARRYQSKVGAMQLHGFDVIPQSQKYTGFELVKEHFAVREKDGWAFEKNFRHPLESLFRLVDVEFILPARTTETLRKLHSDQLLTNLSA